MRSAFFIVIGSLLWIVPAQAQEVSSSTVEIPIVAVSSAAPASEPVILQMSDGRFYNPTSGWTAATREELLQRLDPTRVVDTSVAVASSSSELVAPVIVQAVERGKELLKNLPAEPVRVVKAPEAWVWVTLAVWDVPTDAVTPIEVHKNGFRVEVKEDLPFAISVRNNRGARSEFGISDPNKRIVAVRYPVFKEVRVKKKKRFQVEYVTLTPYTETLRTPEVARFGEAQVDQWIAKAVLRARVASARSRAFPDKLLADRVDAPLMKSIMAIEHLDLPSLEQSPARAVEFFFTNVALNVDAPYVLDRSSAGAVGLLQFIPSTYAMLLKQRPELNLIKNFEAGMGDPQNAILAQIAYLDDVFLDLPADIRRATTTSSEMIREYAVAAYNTGGLRVKRAILSWGEEWSEDQRAQQRKLETRQTQLRRDMPLLKKKITAAKTTAAKKKARAVLAAAQTEQQQGAATLARMNKSRLTKETLDYLLKHRLAIARLDPNIAPTVVASAVSSASGQ